MARTRAALAAAVLAGLTTAGCQAVDGEQRRICVAALAGLHDAPALQVGESRATIAGDGSVTVTLAYTAPAGGRPGEIACRFAGGALDRGRLDLLAVRRDGLELGPAQLLLLERFWLADRLASQSAVASRLTGVEAPPLFSWQSGRQGGYFLQQLVNALPLGATYGLLALAYAMVWTLYSRIAIAFGEHAMIGGYAVVGLLGALAFPLAGAGIAATLGLAVLLAAGHGLILGRLTAGLFAGRLVGAGPTAFLVAGLGLMVALSEATRLLVSSRDRWIQPVLAEPVLLVAGAFRVTVTGMQVLEIALVLAILAGVALVMTRSRFGRAFRAVADDAFMARLVGIDPAGVAATTLALAAALAAAGGAVISLHYGHAAFSSGLMTGLKALVAALIGGIGSLPGAVAGGLILGLGETLWAAYLPLAHREIAVLSAMVVILTLRPSGLFGRPPAGAPDARRPAW